MITLHIKTPIDRDVHMNGHRGKCYNHTPCNIYVFAGDYLLETLDAAQKVDFRAKVSVKEGDGKVDIDLVKVKRT